MKVITLKQPWATLVAEGCKKYEFRSWPTQYRGYLLIHAGKGVDKDYIHKVESLDFTYPTSRIIAKVKLTQCILLDPDRSKEITSQNELIYGNKVRNGYAWKLENVEKINSVKEITGKLSLWNIDESKI